MSERVTTVFVKGSDGNPLRINESDYNEKTHGKQIDQQPPKAAEPPKAPELPNGASNLPNTPPAVPTPPAPVPTPAERFVSKKGKKFVVVNKDGQSIDGTGEYDTEDDAKAALEALDKPATA